MIKDSIAKIFLSEQRSVQQSDVHRSFSTFSLGAYQNTHHFYFPKLPVLRDEELTGGASITRVVEKSSYLVLLPITGDLDYQCATGEKKSIGIGEIGILSLPEGTAITLSNPFARDTINYLQICIQAAHEFNSASCTLFHFDPEHNQQQLNTFFLPYAPFSISLGRFKGRAESTYTARDEYSRLFSFVIAGAFELEHRLLQMRDGLALMDVNEIGFESLSEGAMLLMIELFQP